MLCYILRAIGAGRCRERRYADHIFIQIYFRMHQGPVAGRCQAMVIVKVKFSHTRYRALGPELVPVYRQSARR